MTLSLLSSFPPPPVLIYPTLLTVARGESGNGGISGATSWSEGEKHTYQSFPLPCRPVTRRASLLQEGLVARVRTYTLAYTIIQHSLTSTHTQPLTRGHTRFLSHTHGDEEGWLSGERTLQAAACLGKPDAFLPPGRSTHCHLKGSLLGLIHPLLLG